jgi:hypothetical protein
MITLLEVAASLDRTVSSVRRRALRHGIPMAKVIKPGSNLPVLALDKAAEKRLRGLYPTTLGVPA